jgi:hypothetical protein
MSTESTQFHRRLEVYDRVLATVASISVIIGGIWGMVTYLQAKTKESKDRARESALKKYELELLAYKDQREAFLALCDCASEIAMCKNRDEVEIKSKQYGKLYLGRAHLFTKDVDEVTAKVFEAKIRFHTLIERYLAQQQPTTTPYEHFHQGALTLTEACSKALKPSQAPVPPE